MKSQGAATAAPFLRFPFLAGIAVAALVALALWPAYEKIRSGIAAATPAPVERDYLQRDRLIAFYESQVRANPQDQIQGRMLAQQYMQRYRERFDMGDVLRARRLAQRSITLQPQGNTSAQMTLASTYLAFHDFRPALEHERDAVAGEPSNLAAKAQIASLLMEIGMYDQAGVMLASLQTPREDPSVDAVRARYDELSGKLPAARALIDNAIRTMDTLAQAPAYDRSWYHLRAGQLAFEAGDYGAAESHYGTALADFPDNATALMWRARLYREQGRWREALADASRSADLYPLPQTLGYQADAQRAIGYQAGARATDALIDAEQRIYNVSGVNDRLLALYYAQRKTHLDVALRAAQADYARRGDEIYADDTLAAVYAARGEWTKALRFARRSNRLGTQDPQLRDRLALIEQHKK